nr:hypothetical protein BaRGS_005646 [Batillaria attramentaria]
MPGSARRRRGESWKAANEILHKEIEKLENALRQAESAKEELSQKTDECGKLKKEVVQLKDLKADLEEELQSTSAKNAQFAVQVSDLENQLKELVRISISISNVQTGICRCGSEKKDALKMGN